MIGICGKLSTICKNQRCALVRRFQYKVLYYVQADEAKVSGVVHAKPHPEFWQRGTQLAMLDQEAEPDSVNRRGDPTDPSSSTPETPRRGVSPVPAPPDQGF